MLPLIARFAVTPMLPPAPPPIDDMTSLGGSDAFILSEPDLAVAGFDSASQAVPVAQLFGDPVYMGKAKNRPRVLKSQTGGRKKKRNAPPPKLANERAGEWLEAKLRGMGRASIFRRIGSLFWDPPSLDESVYRWSAEGGTGRSAGKSHALHGEGRPLTERIIEAVRPHVKDAWKSDEVAPHIVELGSGDGQLAAALVKRIGARVQQIDLLEPPQSITDRTVGDITELPFTRNQFGVAVSSFSLEYEGLKAFQEANRVLSPGGRLVSLVHHRKSSLVPNNIIQKGMAFIARDLYRIVAGIRPLRIFLPKMIMGPWEGMARQAESQLRAAFKTKGQAERMLAQAGFQDVRIETVMVPPLAFPNSSMRLDTGWLMTAQKPSRGRK